MSVALCCKSSEGDWNHHSLLHSPYPYCLLISPTSAQWSVKLEERTWTKNKEQTKYVGCTLRLVLFRAAELELDPKSEESEHWISSLSHADLEMLQGQVVWREPEALLRAALPSQGSPVPAYSSCCCWSLPCNDQFGIRLFVTAVLTAPSWSLGASLPSLHHLSSTQESWQA